MTPAADVRCRLGEQPFWDVIHQRLLWTDIDAGLMYELDPRTGQCPSIYSGPPVGGFAQLEDGSLLLFRVDDICRFYRDGALETVISHIAVPGMQRFNDALADPEGRVFAGSTGDAGTAGLFRLNTNGRLDQLLSGTSLANGMGFSPDLRVFYWTDTSARIIYAFDYNRRTGDLTGRRELVVIGRDAGVPDGLTVDAEGCLWSARWNGSAVHRYSPDGEWLSKIELPVRQVSAATFGGADLATLYVTTAAAASSPLEGALFSARLEVRGRLEFFAKVML